MVWRHGGPLAVAFLTLGALLAGCTKSPDDRQDGASVAAGCPGTLADGTVLVCDDWPLSPLTSAEHPDVTTGWACTIDHDDGAPREFFRLYAHTDGRLGWHWRSPRPEGGFVLGFFAVLQPGQDPQWVLTEHAPEGFVALPRPVAPGEGTAFLRFYRFLLHEQVEAGWLPVAGARLNIGADAAGWPTFNWTIPTAAGEATIDLMGQEDDGLSRPDDKLVEIDGRLVSAVVSAHGSSFSQDYFPVARAALGDCTMESLPGGL